jgi:hypothetical protein
MKRAHRRVRIVVFCRALPRGLALSLGGVLASLVICDGAGVEITRATRVLLAIAGCQLGALFALSRALPWTAVDAWHAVQPAGEWLSTALESKGNGGLELLCVRSAAYRVAEARLEEWLPIRAPRFALPAILGVAILLTCLLLPFGLFGRRGFGGGSGNPSNRGDLAKSSGGEVPASVPAAGVGEVVAARPHAPSLASNSPEIPPPPPPDRQPQQPPPASQPQNGPPGASPPPREEIDPFDAKRKLIPIDPRDGLRSNRDALVLEQKLGLSPAGRTAPPQWQKTAVDADAARQLARAAESSLKSEAFSNDERNFVKKYFIVLQK